MNKMIIVLSIILFIVGCSDAVDTSQQSTSVQKAPVMKEISVPDPEEGQMPELESGDTGESGGDFKEFSIDAKKFEFNPNTITVNKGDKVRLLIRSMDVTHGFAIDEYGINVRLTPQQSEVVEFTADKAGEFVYYCNVLCGSGHRDMRGKLIVK